MIESAKFIRYFHRAERRDFFPKRVRVGSNKRVEYVIRHLRNVQTQRLRRFENE